MLINSKQHGYCSSSNLSHTFYKCGFTNLSDFLNIRYFRKIFQRNLMTFYLRQQLFLIYLFFSIFNVNYENWSVICWGTKCFQSLWNLRKNKDNEPVVSVSEASLHLPSSLLRLFLYPKHPLCLYFFSLIIPSHHLPVLPLVLSAQRCTSFPWNWAQTSWHGTQTPAPSGPKWNLSHPLLPSSQSGQSEDLIISNSLPVLILGPLPGVPSPSKVQFKRHCPWYLPPHGLHCSLLFPQIWIIIPIIPFILGHLNFCLVHLPSSGTYHFFCP